MRTIKFRAWDGEKMVSPDMISRDGIAYWKENSIPTSSINLMQYTGLMDKNGKEVYEGDLLKDEGGNVLTVLWLQSNCQFVLEHPDEIFDLTDEGSTFFEVIGNIYENPELLTK